MQVCLGNALLRLAIESEQVQYAHNMVLVYMRVQLPCDCAPYTIFLPTLNTIVKISWYSECTSVEAHLIAVTLETCVDGDAAVQGNTMKFQRCCPNQSNRYL